MADEQLKTQEQEIRKAIDDAEKAAADAQSEQQTQLKKPDEVDAERHAALDEQDRLTKELRAEIDQQNADQSAIASEVNKAQSTIDSELIRPARSDSSNRR